MSMLLMILTAGFGALRIFMGLEENEITVFQIFLAAIAIVLSFVAIQAKKTEPIAPILIALSVTAHK